MILEFSVTNFFCFKNKVIFNMFANASNKLNDNYITLGNKKILKTAAIYGANASGKSNLFKVLNLVKLMLKNSNIIDINNELPIIPFKFDKNTITQPSEFEIKFISNNIKYIYGFKADSKKIYEEYLYSFPKGRKTKIFYRINTNQYSYNHKYKKFLKQIEIKNSDNKFFLATATNWNFSETNPAYMFLTSGIITCFELENFKLLSFNTHYNNYKVLKNFTLNILNELGFNIEDYKIFKINFPDITNSIINFQISFKYKGSNNYLNFFEESLGTQIIFIFIPFIYDSINNKKALIIDELDRSMHPLLSKYILKMFNNSEVNKFASQLIFNTHDTNLLDFNILRKDQIWFTQKNNNNGECNLYSLNNFKVKQFENISKKYLNGRYSALPFIKNFFDI